MNSIKKLGSLLSILVLASPLYAGDLVLGIGASISIPTAPHDKVIISDSKVVKAKDLNSQILLTGKKLGSSQISIGPRSYNLQVVAQNTFQLYKAFQALIETIPSLNLEVKNSCLFVSGKLLVFKDWVKLSDLVLSQKTKSTSCTGSYRFQAKIDSSLTAQILNLLQQEFEKRSLFSISLSHADDVYQVLVPQEIPSDILSKIHRVADSFGLETQKNPSLYLSKNNLRYSVELFLVKSDSMEKSGIIPPGEFSYNLTKKIATEDLYAKLNLLASQGKSKSLIRTHILVVPNQEGFFHSGGEIPIKVSSQYSSSLSWKKYGFIVKLLAKRDLKNQQLVSIQLEFSRLDSSLRIDDVPGVKSFQIHSSAQISQKESVVLTGFSQAFESSQKEGLLWAQSIPFLDFFFRNRNLEDAKQELLLTLTPTSNSQ